MGKGAGPEKVVREIQRRTRRRFSAEEKIRIVLEGLRGEESIAELCRREGLAPNLYYRWSKEFLEAGKKRLLGDTKREATAPERSSRFRCSVVFITTTGGRKPFPSRPRLRYPGSETGMASSIWEIPADPWRGDVAAEGVATRVTIFSLGRGATIVFLALMLIVSTVRVAIINRPFIANSESFACGWVLSSVRNYVRYGPAASRFAGVLNSGETVPANWIIYSHHPPLTALFGAIPMLLAGDSEWTSRFVPAVFSVATTALLFFIARRRFGLRVAAVAGLIYAFCPMTLALGDMAEYLNAPLVFCGVATIGAYGRWLESKHRSWAYGSILFFLLGALSDWPIFYLVPILAAHAVLTGAARVLRVLIIALAAALLFAALASWMLWSGGDVSVVSQFALRASTEGITFRDWIGRVVIYHQGMLHTWPVLVLSGIWAAHLTRQRLMGRWPDLSAHTIPLLLIAWGAIHLVVGVQGTYWHAWWSMILTPAFALMSALGVEVVIGVLPHRIRTCPVAVPLATLAVILFVASSARTAYNFALDEWGFRGNYTLKSIGTAIREASASTEGVLTTVNTDHPALWFYADRQLRPAITSVEALQRSLDAGPYVVFDRYPQRSGPPPTWFVMPVSDQAQLPELRATLDASYPRREMNGVVVYRLRP